MVNIYIYTYIYIYIYHFSLPGFDPRFRNLACLATLKSCNTTKQSVCGWQYIYIYMIKISVKMNKSDTYKCLIEVIFHLSIFQLIFIILSDSPQSTILTYIYIHILIITLHYCTDLSESLSISRHSLSSITSSRSSRLHPVSVQSCRR